MARIWATLVCGANDNPGSEATRFCDPTAYQFDGYQSVGAFIRKWVDPLIAAGFKNIAVWNPFGTRTGEDFQCDQYLGAQASGLRWLYADFAKEWGRITRMPGVEVVGYMGQPLYDPNFSEKGMFEYMRYFERCYQPIYEAGMNIGLDAGSSITDEDDDEPVANHHARNIIQLAESFPDRKHYIEAWWLADAVWSWKTPVFIRDDFYRTIRDQGWLAWARQPDTGPFPEVSRIIVSGTAGEQLTAVHDIVADGHSAMLDGYGIVNGFYTGTTITAIATAAGVAIDESGNVDP